MNWLILGAIAYYLWTQGTFSGLSLGRPLPDTGLDTQLPGGLVIKTPLPTGWRAYRLPDGSQVLIRPNARAAPGGWVEATRNGEVIWFNENTGQIGR